MFQDSANCVRCRRMVSGLNKAPEDSRRAQEAKLKFFVGFFFRLHDVLSTDGDSLDPCYEI